MADVAEGQDVDATGGNVKCDDGQERYADRTFERQATMPSIDGVHQDNARACGCYNALGWVADRTERRHDALGVEVPPRC